MRKSLTLLVLAGVLFAIAAPSLADDLLPPWWRYKDPDHHVNRSTLQQWEFSDDSINPEPEPGYTMPPVTLPHFVVAPGAGVETTGATWIDEDPDSSRQGIWALTDSEVTGIIDLFISNYSGGPEKKIWIQLTWKPQIHIPAPPAPGEPLITGLADFFAPFGASLVSQQSLAEGWIHSTYLSVIQPNPEAELITISGDILVDEVVVDTICPEPATLALLGLGFPLLMRSRRKVRA
jgi:hypothetical protein